MVFDENDAPITVTSTAVPNTTTDGDFRVDRVDVALVNPILTKTACFILQKAILAVEL